MREILFRGKKKNGDWAYGFVDFGGGSFFINEVFETPPTWSDPCGDTHYERHLVDHETIGQYTGLEDKSGVKIFECDVVEGVVKLQSNEDPESVMNIHVYGVVKWSDDGLRFYVSGIDNMCSLDFVCDSYILEVIGNIYENPELMDGEK